MRRIILFAIVFLLNFSFAYATDITVNEGMALRSGFIGFGAEWDSYNYNSAGITDAEFTRIENRVKWMKMPFFRVLYHPGFTAADMRYLYKILDFTKQHGITVYLTDWSFAPVVPANIVVYLNDLINVRGYTNIKYIILGNEPNYHPKTPTFSSWKPVVDDMYARLVAAKLVDKVCIVGPDSSDAVSWLYSSVDQIRNKLCGYDIHLYAYQSNVRSGGVETFFTTAWNYPLSNDPDVASKPFIIGEAGMADADWGSYNYGVMMADYGVQAVRGGTSGVAAWMLTDDSHQGFVHGMIDNRPGLALKPWFYPWSLLSRYVPKNSTIYKVNQPSSDIRLLASKSPGGAWTFVAVNRGSQSTSLKFIAPGGNAVTFDKYLYSESQRPTDGDGFAIPVSSFSAVPSSGVETIVPGNSVVFLVGTGGGGLVPSPPSQITISSLVRQR